jgi:hypothetical protein
MQLGKWLKMMGFITLLSLIYLHMQMKIYALAYQAKVKEHEIQKLRDENGMATYHILSLKSASNIGQKLLSEESQMQFVSNDRVYELAQKQEKLAVTSVAQNAKNALSNLSFNFPNLTLTTAQAEAKTLEKH